MEITGAPLYPKSNEQGSYVNQKSVEMIGRAHHVWVACGLATNYFATAGWIGTCENDYGVYGYSNSKFSALALDSSRETRSIDELYLF